MAGQVEKFQLISFSDEEFKKEKGSFEVQINPSEFKRSLKINYDKGDSTGNNSTLWQFKSIEPESINLNFTLDGTGAVEMPPKDNGTNATYEEKGRDDDYVNTKIDELKTITYNYDGNEHRPPFIAVNWGGGEELFKGILTTMDISYKLFSRSGKPLRAAVSITIVQFTALKVKAEENRDSSPDLTHIRDVKAGDNIMTLTNGIYNDPKYYREIARVNKIVNLRRIKQGQKLFFPPIDKK